MRVTLVILTLSLLLPFTASAQAAIRVRMPPAWAPILQPALDSLSDSALTWLAVDDSVAPGAGRADLSIEPVGQDDHADFTPLILAAVAHYDAALDDIAPISLLALARDGVTPDLPGWQVAISDEARALSDPSALPIAPDRVVSHADALLFARSAPNRLALVRWQTGGGWHSSLRPVRIAGAYPGGVHWGADVRALTVDAGAARETLLAALRAWAEPPVEIAAVGDVMLARSLAQASAHTGDPAFATRRVADLLAGADLTIGNLECVLSERGAPVVKSYTFRAPPSAIEALALAGFDVLSLANNHTMDFGVEALLDTMLALSGAGIAPVGAGLNAMIAHAPVIVERRGVRFAILAFANVPDDSTSNFKTRDTAATDAAPGIAWAEPDIVAAGVAAARAEADQVIVMLHSGYEHQEAPNAIQRAIAHAAVEAGAAAVIGAHPHVLQGVEFTDDSLIAYSLGNFVFDMTVTESALLRLWVAADGVRGHAWEPVTIAPGGQPYPASAANAYPIRARLNRFTALLNP